MGNYWTKPPVQHSQKRQSHFGDVIRKSKTGPPSSKRNLDIEVINDRKQMNSSLVDSGRTKTSSQTFIPIGGVPSDNGNTELNSSNMKTSPHATNGGPLCPDTAAQNGACSSSVCGSGGDVERFVAVHNYQARVEDDLSMTKGQLFNILDRSQGSWWYAQCLVSKRMGYVPFNYLAPDCSLESNEWFFGDMKRLEAEQQLKRADTPHGSFLVRNSESRSGEFSLSVRDKESVKHYRIRSRLSRSKLNGSRYYISREFYFAGIPALITHYQSTVDGLCCQLREPCKKVIHPEPIGLAHTVVDKWEIPKSSIELMEKIGQGQFGEVYRGLWNKTTEVAVKTLKTDCFNTADFLQEAQTMQRLHHQHLIQLYAVCTQSEPFYIITELMPKGSLLNFLQSTEGRRLQLHDLVVMATQISSGMSYLEEAKHIHRDLAARNILVGQNNIVKIADFGLARMISDREYMAHAGARFPIKWTAPEAANYYRFTIKSDVWSFGVLLTEIVTYGRVPYPGMHNVQVLQQIETGYRMPCPPGCPPELYDLMLECWRDDENARPSFRQILHQLTEYRDEERGSYRDLELQIEELTGGGTP